MKRNLVLILVPAALAIMAQSSCTPMTARDLEQCKVDADCTKRGADFRQTRCDVAQGVCVATSAELYSQGECTKHSDCAARGPTFVCSERGNRCIDLKSQDCDRVIGLDQTKPVPDGTVFLGLMSETTKNEFLYFRESWSFEGASLALSHFRGTRSEVLPGGSNVAIVSCGQTQYRRAAAHLAEIGAKAVIGPSQARERMVGVGETLFPAKVPIFTGWANANVLFEVKGHEDLFRVTSFFRPEVMPPLTAMLGRIQRDYFGGRDIKVAGMFNETGDSIDFLPLVEQELRFNKGQTPLQSPSTFKSFRTAQNPEEKVLATAKELVAFAPDVIIPIVEIEWGGSYLGAIEDEFAKATPTVSKPLYLHPFLQLEDAGYQQERFRNKPEATSRFFGLRPLRDIALEVFYQSFGDTFATPSGKPLPPPNAARAYETTVFALHLLYAAMQESGGVSVAPADLVKKIPRLTDPKGSAVRCQSDKISEIAIPTLAKGKNIRLSGLFTQFDFQPGELHASPVWEIWCAKPDLNAYRSGKKFAPENGGTFVLNAERTDDGCSDL
jgi:hypothetical protein